jgi:hypothetical protein
MWISIEFNELSQNIGWGLPINQNQGWKSVSRATIRVYIHPDGIRLSDPILETILKESLLREIAGILRFDIFHSLVDMPLGSQEFTGGVGYDILHLCNISNVEFSTIYKSGGETIAVRCVELTHTGFLQG